MDENDITQLLNASADGDAAAEAELFRKIYLQLRQIARGQMRRELSGHTLQPTALVNEAYLKLCGGEHNWQNRRHFFASAAHAMRQILVDHARARKAAKRGGEHEIFSLMDQDAAIEGMDVDMLALESALVELEKIKPRLARVVELRYFAGLNIDETAEALESSPATIKRDWAYARAWLIDYMGNGNDEITR